MRARVSAEFIIIGSGIAGLRAAVALAPHGRVLILTKSDPAAGSTGFAQGGVAAAVGPDDSPDLHARDTIAAGDGLCDPRAVDVLVHEGPRYVRELIAWGAAFDRAPDGSLALAREAAHSVRRVLHARDATGREIGRVLAAEVLRHPGVTVLDHTLVARAAGEGGRLTGVYCQDDAGQVFLASAKSVLVATGGTGAAYAETTNPPVATGDGLALGYRAGAAVADLEFVQFHPTALDVPGVPRYLLSEALRGEGARLVNRSGEAFMGRYDAAGDLAPRDRVARAIVLERRRTEGPIYLTLAHLDAGMVRGHFPLVTALCREAGLDLATDPIPVGPAAHYMMGGLVTDVDGRTTVPGLFAAGEAADTGVHGANRLASNSLLEGLVFGARAGDAMAAWTGHDWPVPPTPCFPSPAPDGARATVDIAEPIIRACMWNEAGVFRSAAGLARLLDTVEPHAAALAARLDDGASLDAAGWRVASLLAVSRLIARAALRRTESRGAHSRTDFPQRDDLHWLRHATDVR